VLYGVAVLAAYEASHMKHVAGTYGSKVSGAEGDDGNGGAFSRDELNLEGIVGVPMDNRAHVPLLETEVGERPS